MITETQRRAYLDAMQVSSWLPRADLPFAAPSRPEMLLPAPLEPVGERDYQVAEISAPIVADVVASTEKANKPGVLRPRIAMPEPKKPVAVEREPDASAVELERSIPPPRFALQLLRAGSCLLLVELPTGESFQSRDPAYLLLRDLLRAARLSDKPQQVGDGEPIRWPLLHRGSLDQSADAARDYVQGVVAAALEEVGCACLWLIGLPALRFAGEVGIEACYRELNIEGIGSALAMPGLEMLLEEPTRKAELWKVMRRSMSRWDIGS